MSAPDFASGATCFAPDSPTLSRALDESVSGIAIVLHDLRGGGAERACLRLARGMLARGRQVDLVLVRGEGAYFSEIPPGVRITVLNRPGLERRSCECYAVVKKEYDRLLPAGVAT